MLRWFGRDGDLGESLKNCAYYNRGECTLLARILRIPRFGIPENFCLESCGPDDPEKQKRMSMRFGGVYIKEVPPPEKLDEYIERAKTDDNLLWVNPDANPDFIKRIQQQADLEAALKALPSKFHRLVALKKFLITHASPFHKITGLMFVAREHKKARDAICRGCPKMTKEGDSMTCSLCTCMMGKLVDNPNEPDPHKSMLGNLADAVRIQAANWYAAKRCADWKNGNDRFAAVDVEFMTKDQLEKRNDLYSDKQVLTDD